MLELDCLPRCVALFLPSLLILLVLLLQFDEVMMKMMTGDKKKRIGKEDAAAATASASDVMASIEERTSELKRNSTQLNQVAQYCEDIYVEACTLEQKSAMLDKTKGYTIQALASLAYQIDSLARSLIGACDEQSATVDTMSSSLASLGHMLRVHKEKVARREIGTLSSSKYVESSGERPPKLKQTEVPETTVKYVRKAIDYSLLDDVGHGVKTIALEYAFTFCLFVC